MASSSPSTLATQMQNKSIFQMVSVKLDGPNYLLWRAQFLPTLRGLRLLGYVDGTFLCPSKSLPDSPSSATTDSASSTTPAASALLRSNPEYTAWHEQDQLILGWLLSSLKENVLAQVISCETSHSAWTTLQTLFASSSRTRVHDLKHDLSNITKGSLPMADYIKQIKSLADSLAATGNVVSSQDLIDHTLNGLGPTYDPFVISVYTKLDDLSTDDVHSLLLSYDRRLERHAHPRMDPVPLSPNIASSANVASSYNSSGNTSNKSSYSGSNRGGSFNRGGNFNRRGRNNFNASSNRPRTHSGGAIQCQLCGISGHAAITCRRRFDVSYQGVNSLPSAFIAAQSPIHHSNWYPDSGATNHLTADLNNLSLPSSYNGTEQIAVGNGTGLRIQHIGSTSLHTSHGPLVLNNVLHVPSIKKNLLSVSQFCKDHDSTFNFNASGFNVQDNRTGTIILQGPLEGGLYRLPNSSHTQTPLHGLVAERAPITIWHQRLGHPSYTITRRVLSNFSLPVSNASEEFCTSCPLGKSHKLPFFPSTSIVQHPLDLIYSDIWGPAPISSICGANYYIHFVDAFSRYTWIFPMKFKSEVSTIFLHFKNKVETFFERKIKSFHSDGGSEFKALSSIFSSSGITHRQSCPYTHEQNGSAERKHRHIVETGLTLLANASVPLSYWFDAFESATFLINHLPSKVIGFVSPWHKLFDSPPDYKFLKVFGCACYPHLRPYNRNKLQYRSAKCVFLGYSGRHRGYKCLHLESRRIYIARNVVFDESVFPFVGHKPLQSVPHSSEPSILGPIPIAFPAPPICNTNPSSAADGSSGSHQITSLGLGRTSPTISNTTVSVPNQMHIHPMQTRSRLGIRKPNPKYALLTSSLAETEPTSYTSAVKDPRWQLAMADEYKALIQNSTWTLVPPPRDKNIVGNKWVFRIKRKSDGSVERFKARLVAKGYNQQHGVDFEETFSPVIKPVTIRLILTLAVTYNWSIKQLDFSNAFLHGVLQEQVYMKQPVGFVDPRFPQHVCLLHKTIYGLRQSPREWFTKLCDSLLQMGFMESHIDVSLFIKRNSSSVTYVLVYVDDILITGSSSEAIEKVIQALSLSFALKDLGSLNFFLGIEVSQTPDGMLLSQQKYIKDVLLRAKMDDCKPIATPMSSSTRLSSRVDEVFPDPSLYRSTVGALQYLTITRPDISFAVNKVCQYMQSPTQLHWVAVKRILRYLKDTISHGLLIRKCPSFTLQVFSDADWAGCPVDRRSQGAFCIFLGPNLISWSSRKQNTVSRSSTESEYRSLACATTETIWIQQLLRELHISLSSPPILWCDNLGATFLTKNPVFHARTKHVEIDFHFVRERVAQKKLIVQHIATSDQIADALTKPLSRARFLLLRDKLTVVPQPLRLRGAVEVCGS